MDGNRPKAAAQWMPSGKKQDWGDQPLFDQSDLYVVSEALIYSVKNPNAITKGFLIISGLLTEMIFFFGAVSMHIRVQMLEEHLQNARAS